MQLIARTPPYCCSPVHDSGACAGLPGRFHSPDRFGSSTETTRDALRGASAQTGDGKRPLDKRHPPLYPPAQVTLKGRGPEQRRRSRSCRSGPGGAKGRDSAAECEWMRVWGAIFTVRIMTRIGKYAEQRRRNPARDRSAGACVRRAHNFVKSIAVFLCNDGAVSPRRLSQTAC